MRANKIEIVTWFGGIHFNIKKKREKTIYAAINFYNLYTIK